MRRASLGNEATNFVPVTPRLKSFVHAVSPAHGATNVKTIQELKDDFSHKVKSAEDIQAAADKANRPLTAEETKSVKALHAEAEQIKKEIADLEEQDRLRAQTAALTASLAAPGPRVTTPGAPAGGDPPQDSQVRVVPFHHRHGSLKAFTSKLKTPQQNAYDAYKCGMWFAATIYNDRKAQAWLNQHVGHNWQAVMTEGTNTAGGDLVPIEMETSIIDLRETYGVFRKVTRIRPQGSESIRIGRSVGHVTASFTAEATAGSATDRSYNNTQLNAKELYALCYASKNLVDDAIISIIDDITNDMAWAFALKEDQCAFVGDGSDTYGGIRGLTNYFNADAASTGFAGAVNATSGHDTFEEIDNADLARLRAKLPEYARPNAKYICSRACAELVFNRLKAVAGGNTTMTLEGRTVDTFLGDEIVVSQVLPTTSSTINDSFMLAYGDPKLASSMAERRGVTIEKSSEYKFAERQMTLLGTERIDIAWHDLGNATDAGPIVALIGNT